jgi:hypothetical protein
VSARRIRFGSFEHQQREIYARHTNTTGDISYYGDGRHVLAVLKGRGNWLCEVIGEDGSNIWGSEFRYEDYFLPEQSIEARSAEVSE